MRSRMSSRDTLLVNAVSYKHCAPPERQGCALSSLACNLSSLLNQEHTLAEPNSGPTVADLFRRAQAMRKENAQTSYKDLSKQLVREFSGGPFPPTYNLTIPEQDA